MRRLSFLALAALTILLSGCNFKTGSIEENNSSFIETMDESVTEKMEVESVEEKQETTAVENEETTNVEKIQSESKPFKPRITDNDKTFNNEDEGKFFDYRYNEDTNTWDAVYAIRDVSIIHEIANNKVILEYDNKNIELPWAIETIMGTGSGMDMYRMDVTGDGQEDIVLTPYTREAYLVFVFDLVNWKDISPYYCIDANIYKGVYLYREYAEKVVEEMNAVLEKDGYSDRLELNEDGSLNMFRGETGYVGYARETNILFKLTEENALCLDFSRLSAFDKEWSCVIDFSFKDGKCNMEGVNVSTRYTEYLSKVDTVTEYTLAPIVEYDDNEGIYSFEFKNDEVSVSFQTTRNFTSDKIQVVYKGEVCTVPEDWCIGRNYRELYFEYADTDGDGYKELIWNEIYENESQNVRKIMDFIS